MKSWKKGNVLSAAARLNLEQVNFTPGKMVLFFIFAHPNARGILTLAGYPARSGGQKRDVEQEGKQNKVKHWSARM